MSARGRRRIGKVLEALGPLLLVIGLAFIVLIPLGAAFRASESHRWGAEPPGFEDWLPGLIVAFGLVVSGILLYVKGRALAGRIPE